MDSEVLKRTEAIEKLLKGVWIIDGGNASLTFIEPAPLEQKGIVLITESGNEKDERKLEYEVIWVSEQEYYLTVTMPTINLPRQFKIIVNSQKLYIMYPTIQSSTYVTTGYHRLGSQEFQ